MESENALKSFKAAHAEGIAVTKAEFVKFLREGDLPQESLALVALYIYISNRAAQKDNPEKSPTPAGRFFGSVIEDGVYDFIEYWDNPKKHAALMICPMCDGKAHIPKGAVANVAVAPKKRGHKHAVRGV